MQQTAVRDKRRAYMRNYYATNKEKFVGYAQKTYSENKDKLLARAREVGKAQRNSRTGWPAHICKQVKWRAKSEGIEFRLSKYDIKVPDVCPVLGTPFVFGENHPHAPSIDRFDPAKGYVPGNIRVVSRTANMLKNNCTDPEVFRRVALYVEGKL